MATHLANMDYGHGNTESWLPVTLTELSDGTPAVKFERDEDHVSAWHCSHLARSDRRILAIKAIEI